MDDLSRSEGDGTNWIDQLRSKAPPTDPALWLPPFGGSAHLVGLQVNAVETHTDVHSSFKQSGQCNFNATLSAV